MAKRQALADTRRVRWLLAIALFPSVAAADFVVEEPGMYYACPSGKKWDDVKKCLDKQGRPVILKELAGAKLVRLDQKEGALWVDGGVYLYVDTKREWKIAGSFFGRGTDYELVDVRPLSVGKHAGFRIDIAQASPLYVQLDGLTSQLATRRAYQTLFCSPAASYCAQAIRSCEVLVRGHAYWTFRGDMKLNGNEITIAGDRRLAGPFCSQTERVLLGWPQT
jgi:hypothetical protein